MAKKQTRDDLIKIVNNLLNPKGFTTGEMDQQLLLFCINCPDPAAAMDIIVNTVGPVTATGLVDRALQCPPRDITAISESELSLKHPLRHMKLDE